MARPTTILGALVAGTVWVSGCSDNTGPNDILAPDAMPGLIVSQPVGGASAPGVGAVRAPRSAAVSGSAVYVSLVPGTVPMGILASIRDQANGQSVTAPVVDGGFDPVAIIANVGDTLLVTITRSDSLGPVRALGLVRAHHPPVVVRTSPPNGGRDVPLNAVMIVVFSDPIDSATLTTGSVQLWRGTALVGGTVRLGDSLRVRIEVHLGSLLAGETTYRLEVTTSVQDVAGVALASALDVQFTTGITPPPAGLVFASVTSGGMDNCGLTTSGSAYCWGANFWGQLGNGTMISATTPVAVAGGLTFARLSAGLAETCGVTTTGAAYCWGLNFNGQLGYGASQPSSCISTAAGITCPVPVPVAGGLTFTSVSPSDWSSCGVTTSGAAYCWGAFGSALGFDESQVASCVPHQSLGGGWCPTPVPVSSGLSFASVTSSGDHACGVATNQRAYCWGGNDYGQLGDSSTAPSVVPVAVAGGLTFDLVSASGLSNCGLTTGGAAYCWGAGDEGMAGELTEVSPVPVAAGFTFVSLSGSCGVTTSGNGYCWSNYAPPVQIPGGLTFAQVSGSCGITTSGVAYCWGSNSYGQLGNGTTTDSDVPVKVAGQP